MAGTTKITRPSQIPGSGDSTAETTTQLNKLIDDLETVRAALATLATKLNADAGVTDTNYAAPAAAALTAAKVGDHTGTAL
jgi:hypothetical protein